mgnify:FL=1
MATVKFTKKEISEILKSDYATEFETLKKQLRKYHLYFCNGVECKSIPQFINWISETEGNYSDLHA